MTFYRQLQTSVNEFLVTISSTLNDLKVHEFETHSISDDEYVSTLSEHTSFFNDINSMKEFCHLYTSRFLTSNLILNDDELIKFVDIGTKYLQKLTQDLVTVNNQISIKILAITIFMQNNLSAFSNFI